MDDVKLTLRCSVVLLWQSVAEAKAKDKWERKGCK